MDIRLTHFRVSRQILWSLVIGLVASAVTTHADFLGGLNKFLQKDVDVITVTDVTPIGKTYRLATPERPVRYMMINRGYVSFGNSWGGEAMPSNKAALLWMMKAMRAQGYLLADAQHPPEQVFIYKWGMLSAKSNEPPGDPDNGFTIGSPRVALKFLGGDKVNLMWEQQTQGMLDPRVLLRGMIRTGVAGKVWDFAGDDLFLGAIRSYPLDFLLNPKAPILWETRFACPSTGLAMDRAMPLLIAAAAPYLGRETAKPISVNATRTFGNVSLGELKVLSMGNDLPTLKTEQEKTEDSSAK